MNYLETFSNTVLVQLLRRIFKRSSKLSAFSLFSMQVLKSWNQNCSQLELYNTTSQINITRRKLFLFNPPGRNTSVNTDTLDRLQPNSRPQNTWQNLLWPQVGIFLSQLRYSIQFSLLPKDGWKSRLMLPTTFKHDNSSHHLTSQNNSNCFHLGEK